MRKIIFHSSLFSIALLWSMHVHAQDVFWVRVPSGATNDLNSIACPDARTCYAVGGAPFIGGNGIILKTADGGETWRAQAMPVSNPLRGISCVNASQCYAAGDGGTLLKTVNGGVSWTRLGAGTRAAEQYYWSIGVADANTAVAVANGGKIFHTANGGTTWTEIPSGTTQNLHGVHFANGAIGWIMGGGGTLLKTINGGATWLPLTTPAGTNIVWDAHSRDGRQLWISGDFGVFTSNDGGLTLTRRVLEPMATYRGVYMVNETNGWAVGANVVQHTVDGGASWQSEWPNITTTLRDIACTQNVCYAVGDDGVIMRRGAAPPPQSSPTASAGAATPMPSTTPLPGQRVTLTPEILRALGTRLFRDDLQPEQKRRAEQKTNEGTKRIKGLNLDPRILENDQIDFNFFPDLTLIGQLTRREERPDGTKVWKGRIKNKPGSRATIIQVGDKVMGNIVTRDGNVVIRPSRDGGYTVREINPALFPEDLHLAEPDTSSLPRASVPPERAAEAVVFIDVLGAYTNTMVAEHGNHDYPQMLIRLMIEDANDVLDNSNIGMRFRLVGTHHVGIDDAGDVATDLSYIRDNIRGEARELHEAREALRADLVSMIVLNGGGRACGIGSQMTSENFDRFADRAYSVIDADCIDGSTVFMHEAGHNMGAGHNREDQFDADGNVLGTRYPYSYGYRSRSHGFRTVMSYGCREKTDEDACPRIPYLSSPTLTYEGYRLGVADESDNARTLMNTRWIVEDFNGGSGGDAARAGASAAAEELAVSAGVDTTHRASSGRLGLLLRNVGRAARMFIAFAPEKKAELHLRYANEYVLEADALASDGKHDAAASQLKKFQKEIQKAETQTKHVMQKKPAKAPEAAAELLKDQVKHQILIEDVRWRAPEVARADIERIQQQELERMKNIMETLDVSKRAEEVVENIIKAQGEPRAKQQSIEVLKEVQQKVPEKAKEAIQKALEQVTKPTPLETRKPEASASFGETGSLTEPKPTATLKPTPRPSPKASAGTATPSPKATPALTPTPAPTPSPDSSPLPQASSGPSASPTATPKTIPTPSPAPSPKTTPTPTPKVTPTPTPTPTPMTKFPDLIVFSTSTTPAFPAVKNTVTFSAAIKNQGSVSAGASYVRLRIDVGKDGKWDIVPANVFVSSLASGAIQYISWKSAWVALSGTHMYEICADAASQVAELIESNNCISTTFSVK